MGAFLALYVAGSFLAIPVLAWQLLRMRRELNALREALRARGIVAPGDAPVASGFAVDATVEGTAALDGGAGRLAALAAEVQRLAEEQRALQRALVEPAPVRGTGGGQPS